MAAAAGCATKGWVNDMFGQKQAQMDERFARVDGSVREVGEAGRVAQGRADAAFGRADDVSGRLTRLWTGRNKRTVVETLHVQFAFDRSDLSDGAQTALLGVVKELKTNADLTVDLEGYTDSTGPKDYNVSLSQRRVETVRRYLVDQGADGTVDAVQDGQGFSLEFAPHQSHAIVGRQGSNDFCILFKAQFVVCCPVKKVSVFGCQSFPIMFKGSLNLSRRRARSEDEVFWEKVLHGIGSAKIRNPP